MPQTSNTTLELALKRQLLNHFAGLSNITLFAADQGGTNSLGSVVISNKFGASTQIGSTNNARVDFLAQESASITIPEDKTVDTIFILGDLVSGAGSTLLEFSVNIEFPFGGNLIITNVSMTLSDPS